MQKRESWLAHEDDICMVLLSFSLLHFFRPSLLLDSIGWLIEPRTAIPYLCVINVRKFSTWPLLH